MPSVSNFIFPCLPCSLYFCDGFCRLWWPTGYTVHFQPNLQYILSYRNKTLVSTVRVRARSRQLIGPPRCIYHSLYRPTMSKCVFQLCSMRRYSTSSMSVPGYFVWDGASSNLKKWFLECPDPGHLHPSTMSTNFKSTKY